MIIDRYIIREVVRPLLLASLILVLIFAAYTSATYLADAAGGRLRADTVATLIGLNTLIGAEVLLPTAFYLSVVIGLGRMYRDGEMAALFAAGVSELRVLWAVLQLSLLIATVVGAISLYARPWAYRLSYMLEAKAVIGLDTSHLQAGHFQRIGGGNQVLLAEQIDRVTGHLHRVFVQLDDGEKSKVIYAREAYLPPVNTALSQSMVFLDGYAYDLDRQGGKDLSVKYIELTIHFGDRKEGGSYKRRAAPSAQLAGSSGSKDIAELQWRLSTPIATLVLGLLGVPLSRASPRTARYVGVVIAIIVFAVLFNLLGMAKTWVEHGTIAPVPGIWWVYAAPVALLVYLLARPVWMLRTSAR